MNFIVTYFEIIISELYKAGATFEVALAIVTGWTFLLGFGGLVLIEKILEGLKKMFKSLNELITSVNMMAHERLEKNKEEDMRKNIKKENNNPNSVFYTGDSDN